MKHPILLETQFQNKDADSILYLELELHKIKYLMPIIAKALLLLVVPIIQIICKQKHSAKLF